MIFLIPTAIYFITIILLVVSIILILKLTDKYGGIGLVLGILIFSMACSLITIMANSWVK